MAFMRTRFDQLGKGIVGRIGGQLGQVRTQYEIPGEVQAVDILFWPDEQRAPERARLGLMGRMLDAPCVLECFHDTPREDEIKRCVSRLVALHAHLERRPEELEKLRPSHGAQPAHAARSALAASSVRMWIVSAGRPERSLESMKCEPMSDGWGPGFWRLPEPWRTSIVVVRDLPEEHETLPLRLLGAGRTLSRALQELRELPREAWEAELASPLVLAFRIEADQNHGMDTMQYVAHLEAIYERWRQETLQEGRQEGLETGLVKGRQEGMETGRRESLRHSLRMVYRARFGQEPAALAAALDAAGIEALERWLPLFATATSDEIARSVRSESQ